MLPQNLLCKFRIFSKLCSLNGPIRTSMMRSLHRTAITKQWPKSSKGYSSTTSAQAAPPRPPIPPQGNQMHQQKPMTSMQGLREFLMHPLTWDRNNGFFNILLGLTIFAYCFCTACKTDQARRVSYDSDRRR